MNKLKLHIELDTLSNFLEDANLTSYVGNLKELTSLGLNNDLKVIVSFEGRTLVEYIFNKNTNSFEQEENDTSP